jgi:leucine efflux protein
MYGISDYPAFVVAVLVFLAIPGPGNLALLTSTAYAGVRGGLAATLGVIVGDQVLLWLAVAGVAAVLAAAPEVFATVQAVGAVYLAWLGWRLWRTQPGDAPVLRFKPSHFFRQTFFITLLNPKAIVFYMAFFPLFIDPEANPGWSTYTVLALTIAVLTFAYGLVLCVLAQRFAAGVRARPQVSAWLHKLAGGMLIGFGLKLALGK